MGRWSPKDRHHRRHRHRPDHRLRRRAQCCSVEVTLTTGGHPPPLLLRADGTARYLPARKGPLIGVLEDATYGKQTLRIEAGDTLPLYTDGLTDARVPGAGERFGAEEILAFANRLAPATAASAVEAVTALLASFDGGLDDDVAVIAIGAPADSAGR